MDYIMVLQWYVLFFLNCWASLFSQEAFEGCYWILLLSKVKTLWSMAFVLVFWDHNTLHWNGLCCTCLQIWNQGLGLAFPALSCWHSCSCSLPLMLVEAEICTSRVAFLVSFFCPSSPRKPNGRISGSSKQHHKCNNGRSMRGFLTVSCFLWNSNGFNMNLYASLCQRSVCEVLVKINHSHLPCDEIKHIGLNSNLLDHSLETCHLWNFLLVLF